MQTKHDMFIVSCSSAFYRKKVYGMSFHLVTVLFFFLSLLVQLKHFWKKLLTERVCFSACGICFIDRQMLTSVMNQKKNQFFFGHKKLILFTCFFFSLVDCCCDNNIFGHFAPVSKINDQSVASNWMHENNAWMVMNPKEHTRKL